MDTFITEEYFNWLKSETFMLRNERLQYEGVLRVLHEIPFMWVMHSDDNRSGDAVTFRQYEFLDCLKLQRDVNQVQLGVWANSAPSVLEVLLGCARRWAYFFGGGEVSFYFNHMFRNMGFDQFPGKALGPEQQETIRNVVDTWLMRHFAPNGVGSPFPLNFPEEDQTHVDMWGQMNAYSAEHFQ